MNLIHLGFAVIGFIISYGIIFTFTPMLLGSVFTALDSLPDNPNADWSNLYETNKTAVQFLLPLIPTIGILILVIRVLMRAGQR
jgi:hypothetical protein